jgi:translocation and assembly module TamB
MSKRILLILLPVVIAFAAIYGAYEAAKPKIQNWILSQVNRISAEKLPVHLKIAKVDWGFLFPEIELEGIEISAKDFAMPTVRAEKLTASLDILGLVSGRVAVSSLLLEKPQVEVQLDAYLKNTKKSSDPLPMKEFFDLLKKVPVSQVGLHEGNILLNSEKFKWGLLLGAADLLVVKGKDRLNLQWDFNDSVLDYDVLGEIPFRAQGEAMMTASNLDISNLKIGFLNSLLTAKGSLQDLPRIAEHPQGTVEFELFSELDQLSGAGKNLLHLPPIAGKINANGRIEINAQGKVDSGFKFSSQHLKIAQFEIGDIQFQGNIQKDLLKIPRIAITNEAGLVDVHDLELDFSEKENQKSASIKAHIKTDQIDINELLQRLGIGDLPIEVLIGADFKCSGPLFPQAEVKCQGHTDGDQLEVRTGRQYEDTLLLVDSFKADGDFSITEKEVRYKAQLAVGEDKGSTDGSISFKDGFKINYASPAFHFKNLRRLAGLRLEGVSEVQGSTQGDSHAATFGMQLKTSDFVFENFKLGSPSGSLSYNQGILQFRNLEANFTASHYTASLDVDLHKKRISAAGQLSRFDVPELLTVFERIFKMPVEFTGLGKATFKVEGPFSLGKLSYDLNTTILHGVLAGESYDEMALQMHSDSGEMKIQNAFVTKNKNELHVTGESHPDGQVNLLIRGRKLPLEESENVSKLGSQITGLLDLDTTLKGFILQPDVHIQGHVYQLNVEEQDFADSTIEANFQKQMMSGKTNLFNNQLIAQFKIPLTETAPFQLDLKAQNWNYTTLLALVGGGSLLNEYKASLSGELQLASDHGGLWTSSGHGIVRDFLLQRGGLKLQNKAPMLLNMNNGLASLEHFRIEGDQTFFDIKGSRISNQNLNLRLDGQANLRLFQIFVPFLEELAGTAYIAADFSGPLLKPEILGTANVRSGFAKLKGFPHAFEKTQADVQFSQSKIIINGFLGNIAGGTFQGDGSILIAGPQSLPTTVKAHLESVNLNVPDHVRTTGDADVIFSGSWFPFTLSGTYHVQGGYVDKELAEESSANNLKQSSYLPKMILQSAFEPVLLDLNIILEKPLTIKNSMVEGAVSGNILVKGAPTSPALGGQLAAEKGTKAIFRDKVFDVQTATVHFNNDIDINPDLYVSASSRIDEYDVTMLIQGSAKNPAIKLSSLPPLNDQDIISLIALGVKSQSLEKQVQAGNKAKAGDAMQGVALGVFTQRGPLKKLQESAGVQLQFSTSYDDTRNVSVQRVTLSKKISDRVRASATQTSATVSSSNEYSLQYSFTDNLSAIGRYEDRRANDSATSTDTYHESQSILGIDLEFKKEFK